MYKIGVNVLMLLYAGSKIANVILQIVYRRGLLIVKPKKKQFFNKLFMGPLHIENLQLYTFEIPYNSMLKQLINNTNIYSNLSLRFFTYFNRGLSHWPPLKSPMNIPY